VLIVTAIVCARAFGNGFVIDDNDLIVQNVAIGDWSFPLKALTHDEYWFSNVASAKHSRYRPLLLIWF